MNMNINIKTTITINSQNNNIKNNNVTNLINIINNNNNINNKNKHNIIINNNIKTSTSTTSSKTSPSTISAPFLVPCLCFVCASVSLRLLKPMSRLRGVGFEGKEFEASEELEYQLRRQQREKEESRKDEVKG